MEDGEFLSKEDKQKMETLKLELAALKKEHKEFASRKSKISPEEREAWRKNSTRTNEVYIEIKELRLKNVLGA